MYSVSEKMLFEKITIPFLQKGVVIQISNQSRKGPYFLNFFDWKNNKTLIRCCKTNIQLKKDCFFNFLSEKKNTLVNSNLREFKQNIVFSLHKKWSFPLTICAVSIIYRIVVWLALIWQMLTIQFLYYAWIRNMCFDLK